METLKGGPTFACNHIGTLKGGSTFASKHILTLKGGPTFHANIYIRTFKEASILA